MDVFKVGMTTVDQIRPVLADLIQSLNNVLSLPADFEGRAKVREWLTKLDSMGAVDKLSAEDKGQLEFDLETNCTAFRGWLEGPR
ncbi:hypothetical protein B0O80DRAFT_98658 [Mortierella sp. GBAus27b]|nr:hypothetical protein B0O80DRAFT_98658 [Mortierella sp. GBAus27b]